MKSSKISHLVAAASIFRILKMYKRFLLVILLFNSMAVLGNPCSTNGIIDDALAPSAWRNTETGDWEISFYAEGAVCDTRFWQYKQRMRQGSRWLFLLTDGKEELSVWADMRKNGLCKMTIGNRSPVVCRRIVTNRLPDYPTKDASPIKDTGCLREDSVTIEGWLRHMSAKEKSQKSDFDVTFTDVMTNQEKSFSAKTDPDGHFCLTLPLLNTTEVYLDWQRSRIVSVFEPGETYFLLCDFETGERFIMGKHARLQNEILMTDFAPSFKRKDESEDFPHFMQEVADSRKANETAFNKMLAAHPRLSERFKEYTRAKMKYGEAYTISQAKYSSPSFRLPPHIRAYALQHFVENPACPFTLYRELVWFMNDLLDDGMEKSFSEELREAAELYHTTLTDEEKEQAQKWDELIADMWQTIEKAKGDEEKIKVYEAYQNDNLDIWDAYANLSQKYAVEMEGARLRDYKRAVDSLGCSPDLKDMLMAGRYSQIISRNRHSLAPSLLERLHADVGMPAAKARVMAEHLRYQALERQDFKNATCLKSNEPLAGIKEGKELLAKMTEPYRGHYVLIDVWGTWCAPCKEALSHSESLYETLAPYDMIFMYLASNSPEESWKNTIQEYRLTRENCVHYNLPRSQQQTIEKYFRLNSYPTYRLIDPQGNVMDTDADPRNLPEFERLMRQLSE